MAVKRTVDLGTVGFGLVADTRSLQDSLNKLQAFGQKVNQLSSSTNANTKGMYAQFAQIERILTTLQARTTAVTQRMKESGVAAAEIDKVTKAYQRLQNTLTQQAGVIPRHEMARGVVGMSAILQRGGRLAAAQEASKFTAVFRDLERAAILAVGPLSGVGARLAVMASLFETTSARMTLFIAGTVGTATGLGLLTAAGIKATMQMQQFDALLETATGSMALVADEYQYVSGLANKLGLSVKSTTEAYAKFATAARLSNMSLQDQRKIFEGATTAAAAMRLSGERTSLVFLALEQMVSKGTVSMEELRRQLGDLLPGSIALAAKAMGVSQSKLIQMIESGEVLAKDLLPKLAEQWQIAFGPGAQRAAVTLQAELTRVSNATFEFLKKFDEVTGATRAFTAVVKSTAELLKFLTSNMNQVIQVMGAFAGGAGALLVYSALTRLIAVLPTAIVGFNNLAKAITALSLASMASSLRVLLPLLTRLGVVAVGAAVGFALLKSKTDDSLRGLEDWISYTDDWIKIQKELGVSHAQTTAEQHKGSLMRLDDVNKEIAITQQQIDQLKKLQEQSGMQGSITDRLTRFLQFKVGLPSIFGPNEQQKLEDEVKKLTELRQKLMHQLEEIGKLKVEAPQPDVDEASKQWQTWVKRIEKSIREYQGLIEQIKGMEVGKEFKDQAKGMAEALDVLAAQPEKGRGSIEGISKALKEAGFEAGNFTGQLAKLFGAIEDKKDVLRDLEKFPERFKRASESVSEMFEQMDARRGEALAADPQEYKNNERLASQLLKLQGYLENMKLTQEQINIVTKEYRASWEDLRIVERHQEQLRAFARDVSNVLHQLERDIAKTWVDIMLGGESTWRSLFQSILREALEFITRMLVIRPIMQGLFGGYYTGAGVAAGGTGLLGGMFGFLSPGSSGPQAPPYYIAAPGFAEGTDFVPRDMLARVHRGERIVPASENRSGSMGNTFNISIAVDAKGARVSGDTQSATELGKRLENAVRNVLVQEQRPGGLLAAAVR